MHYLLSYISCTLHRSPPQVKMLTRIEHPCVLNGQIQLDMLSILDIKRKNFHPPSTAMSKYRYWFPGYTTLSILIQLEGRTCDSNKNNIVCLF